MNCGVLYTIDVCHWFDISVKVNLLTLTSFQIHISESMIWGQIFETQHNTRPEGILNTRTDDGINNLHGKMPPISKF